jgi:hypothetical protein
MAPMVEHLTGLPAHTVGFKTSGKLHDEDYKAFVPLVDADVTRSGTCDRALVTSRPRAAPPGLPSGGRAGQERFAA